MVYILDGLELRSGRLRFHIFLPSASLINKERNEEKMFVLLNFRVLAYPNIELYLEKTLFSFMDLFVMTFKITSAQ